MEGHVYLSKGSKDVWLGMSIMCLSGGTCLPEQREQRRMAWNEDNVSEWRDISTRAKGAKTWNEDNVSEWRVYPLTVVSMW